MFKKTAARIVLGLMALGLGAPLEGALATSRAATSSTLEALQTGSLKSIAAWLKESGRDGYLAADVADALGIPREQAEQSLDAKQRGFKQEDVLRIAQISA